VSQIKLSENFVKNSVKLALNEDLYPSGDITSNLKRLVLLAIKNKKNKKITVEIDTLSQLKEIIGLKFDTVLFDNMNLKNLKAGVKIAKEYYTTEASVS